MSGHTAASGGGKVSFFFPSPMPFKRKNLVIYFACVQMFRAILRMAPGVVIHPLVAVAEATTSIIQGVNSTIRN
jgi:hypothetical protein